jgi:hypothetical protein
MTTFIMSAGQSLTPFSNMKNASSAMFAQLGNILVFYDDHDAPRFMKLVHMDTGDVLDIKIRPKMDDVQEFLSNNYEHGAHRDYMAEKVVKQGYCPVCKEDNFYYMSYRRTCTNFGRNEHGELHFGLCTMCNHFKRYEVGSE